jgi:hypothetical protein
MLLCLSLLPRERFERIGGLRTDLRLGEDHEFAVRMHRSGMRYVATDVPLIRVRLHGGPRLSSEPAQGFGERAFELWSRILSLAAPDRDRRSF